LAKRGRKRIEIDWKEYEALCAIQATLREMACFFQCSEDTIERAVVLQYRLNFAEVFAQKRQKGFISLRRTMWQGALGGNPGLQIFLAKQYLGMANQMIVNPPGGPPIAGTPEFDLARLSDDQLEQLERVVETATGQAPTAEDAAAPRAAPAAQPAPDSPAEDAPPPPPVPPTDET